MDKKSLATFSYEWICQNSNNHKYFTCEVSAQHLYNSSTGYPSNFTSAIEAKSLNYFELLMPSFLAIRTLGRKMSKVGLGLQNGK